MAKSSTGMYPQCQKHGISPEIMDRDLTEVEYITNALVMELNVSDCLKIVHGKNFMVGYKLYSEQDTHVRQMLHLPLLFVLL